ncbi:MAG: DUF4339 domain-containing protein [Deltaproteobacteria bacterium]|nr:DUF4339 domain-containing protein [Deltaproteobacteria bacterium]
MAPADQWRWTDDDGVQRLLNGEELRAALRDGRLKPTTLVWRRGMKSWQPAMTVDELIDGADSVTMERKGGALPGTKRAPSPSIPAPGLGPSNMVNIEQLRAQQKGPRRHTMQGVGDPVARSAPRDEGLAIPAAPKLPDVGGRSPRPRTTDIDGLWSEGAARRDDDEQTITRLRSVEEEATLNEKQARKAPSVAPQAKRSVPPPVPKRTVPYTGGAAKGKKAGRGDAKRTKRKLPPAQARRKAADKAGQPVPSTLVSGGDDGQPKVAPGTARPQLKSDEVLSAGLPSNKGMKGPDAAAVGAAEGQPPAPTLDLGAFAADGSGQYVDAAQQQAGAPVGADGGAAPKVAPATEPLPAMRPTDPSRPNPEFAQEPWNRQQNAESVQVRTATPAQPHAPTMDAAALLAPPQFQVPADLSPKSLLPFKLNKAILGGAAGGTVVMLFLAFIVGRCSVPVQSEIVAAVEARSGLATVPLFARSRTANQLKPRPCLMQRAPSRWARAASVRIPIEIVGVPGGKLAVGYARSKVQARGLLVSPVTGEAEATFEPEDEYEEDLSRVVPVVVEGEPTYQPTLVVHGDVQNAVYAPAKSPFVLGFGEAAFVRLADPGSDPDTLWALEPPGKRGDALRTIAVAGKGIAVTYRYAGRVYHALLKDNGSVSQAVSAIAGSGGKVGKPNVGSNGRDLSVVFADRPPKARAAEIRWAHGPIGEALTESEVVELPAGGPGGEAIAPAIAGLSGGRWLLMWTEGRRGARTLRAQTYDRKYQPVGDALRVSPATGSFGQGIIGVVGENAVVVFLLATRRSYQVWGTVLQCE